MSLVGRSPKQSRGKIGLLLLVPLRIDDRDGGSMRSRQGAQLELLVTSFLASSVTVLLALLLLSDPSPPWTELARVWLMAHLGTMTLMPNVAWTGIHSVLCLGLIVTYFVGANDWTEAPVSLGCLYWILIGAFAVPGLG